MDTVRYGFRNEVNQKYRISALTQFFSRYNKSSSSDWQDTSYRSTEISLVSSYCIPVLIQIYINDRRVR